MQTHSDDSTRILRLAGWVWVAYLAAMATLDFFMYSRGPFSANLPNQSFLLQNLRPNPGLVRPANALMPVYIYYLANGLFAGSFLIILFWDWVKIRLGRFFYPVLIIAISATPIIINVLIVPRFPNGPLANSEGMALRQLPVLFLGLALVAWQYRLPHVILYSIATTGLELGLIFASKIPDQGVYVLTFVAIVRTISFFALGVFISLIVTRLREQHESLSLANADLAHYASTLEQLTISRERNRMSRELHDTVVHSLSGLSVQLETAKAYLEVDPVTSKNLLESSLEATRTGLQETRRAIKALRASPLEDLGLVGSLRKLIETTKDRANLAVDVLLPGQEVHLAPDVEQGIYRIAQEAVENVVQHASAQQLIFKFTVDEKIIRLMIQDDGIGFSHGDKTVSGHFGLAGMHERAQFAGGELSINSKPSTGTTVLLGIKRS